MSQRRHIDHLASQFEDAFQEGMSPRIEHYLPNDLFLVGYALKELVAVEVELRRARGESVALQDYIVRFPGHRELLTSLFQQVTDRTLDLKEPQTLRSSASQSAFPARVGRYEVQQRLGSGAFADVFAGWDETIRRAVAIKIPHADACPTEQADLFLDEARVIASLDEHPHIVPVYDAGRLDDGRCYVVSKLIDGVSLRAKTASGKLDIRETLAVVAAIASALHHAHKKGVVHRDVKPDNILIDLSNRPFLADFGLAQRHEHVGSGAELVGTPAYMSPEQAEGRGHLADGRSDIFSLGVVLFELLTGRRPHLGATREDLLRNIVEADVRPPRQINENIPVELERVCLKALQRDPTSRYTTAFDLAKDLEGIQSSISQPRHTSLEAIPRAVLPVRLKRGYDLAVAMDLLLPYLANRAEHEHHIQLAIEQARANQKSVVCCVIHGHEDQCHDTFVERLRESTLRIQFGVPSDRPVKRYHIVFPKDAGTTEEYDERLRIQLAEKMRLSAAASDTDVAQAMALLPWPILVYSEMAFDGSQNKTVDSFFSYWNNLPMRPKEHPTLVCLGIVYRRGASLLAGWRARKRERTIRRTLQQIDLTTFKQIVGVVLPELRDLTRDDAENWLQGWIADFAARERLRPKVRSIFGRAPQISMEQWSEALQSAVDSSS